MPRERQNPKRPPSQENLRPSAVFAQSADPVPQKKPRRQLVVCVRSAVQESRQRRKSQKKQRRRLVVCIQSAVQEPRQRREAQMKPRRLRVLCIRSAVPALLRKLRVFDDSQ